MSYKLSEEAEILQRDLNSGYAWGQRLGMFFNVEKCNVILIIQSRNRIAKFYTLRGQILEQVNYQSYYQMSLIGPHIWTANSTLGLLFGDIWNSALKISNNRLIWVL